MSEPSGADLLKALQESVQKARATAERRKAELRQIRVSGLREQLIRRITECAPRSLRHYAAHDLDRFGIEAGVAVELAAKAVLVDINPCLIADQKHFDSMLALSGQAGSLPFKAVKTVGGAELLRRVAKVVSGIRVTELEPLAEARNGALHLVGADAETAYKTIAPYIDAMRIMADALKVPFEDVFGDYSDLAKAVLERAVKEAEIRAQAKIAEARQAFEHRFGEMNDQAREVVIQALTSTQKFLKYREEPTPCPACKQTAKLHGDAEFVEWLYEGDDEGVTERYPRVVFEAESLECPFCELRLAGKDELEGASVPVTKELEDVDPSDFEEAEDEDEGEDRWERFEEDHWMRFDE